MGTTRALFSPAGESGSPLSADGAMPRRTSASAVDVLPLSDGLRDPARDAPSPAAHAAVSDSYPSTTLPKLHSRRWAGAAVGMGGKLARSPLPPALPSAGCAARRFPRRPTLSATWTSWPGGGFTRAPSAGSEGASSSGGPRGRAHGRGGDAAPSHETRPGLAPPPLAWRHHAVKPPLSSLEGAAGSFLEALHGQAGEAIRRRPKSRQLEEIGPRTSTMAPGQHLLPWLRNSLRGMPAMLLCLRRAWLALTWGRRT